MTLTIDTNYLNYDRETNLFVAHILNEECGRVGASDMAYYNTVSTAWANILSLYA